MMNIKPPSSYRLMEIVALAQATLSHLREYDGQVIETEDELRAGLTEEGISIDEIITRLGRAALDAKAYVGMISQRMSDLQSRMDRANRRKEVIRNTLLQAMQALGLPSYHDPEFTASVRMGEPKVIVTDVDALPTHCVVHQVVKTPDKDAIREAISDAASIGKDVPGATLSNGVAILTLRSK